MDRLEALVVELKTFVEEREWGQFHDPKNLAMAIASEAGELLAEYRWISSADADRVSMEPERRERIAAEIADVGISRLLFCDRIALNLCDVISMKIERNRISYPVAESRGQSERPDPKPLKP